MTEIVMAVSEEGADDVRLEDLGRLLRDELLQLPEASTVAAVATGEAPPGTRGGLIADAGALVVTAQPHVAAVAAVVGSVWRWLRRGGGGKRTIRLEIDGDVIELSGATNALQEQLVEDWISRHSTST